MDFSQQGLMGALAQLAQAQQQGTQRADAAYGALAGHLQEPMDRSGALMRMAQGFMSPTRTGGFAESAGLAIGGFADARDRMQDMDLARRKKLAEIEAARAKLGMQAAQNQFNIHETGLGLQQGMQRQSAWDAFGQGTMPTDGAMTLNDIAPSGMGAPTLSSSGFDAPVIRPGADMPAAGASPAGDLIPPVTEGSFFIPPGDTGQSRRIRQSEADMFGMPEGMDQRPAPGYSPFDDAGMMGTLPDRGAADIPAQGAGQRQAAPQPQGRSRGDGFRVANDAAMPGLDLSPTMTMTPEQGRRFEAQPQARQAPAQGRQQQQAPQRQGLGFPRPQGVKGRAYDEVERLMNTPEGMNLRRVDPEGWQERYDRNWKQLKDTPEYKDATSERRLKERQMVENGVPENIASGISSGQIRIDRHPVSGRLQVVDMATGSPIHEGAEAERIATGVSQADQDADARQIVSTDEATGVGGFGRLAANTVAEYFGGNLPFERAEEASQVLRNLRTRTQIALATQVAGRPSNYLLEMFDEMAVKPGDINLGPQRARQRFGATIDYLENERRVLQSIIDNKDNYPPADVGGAMTAINQLDPLIEEYKRVHAALDRVEPSAAPQNDADAGDTPTPGNYRWNPETNRMEPM